MQTCRLRNLISVVTLFASILLATWTGLNPPSVSAEDTVGPRRLTFDGTSRVAGWSSDGTTLLVNRWGRTVGDMPRRQVLSELWAITARDGLADRLTDNGLYPTYDADQERLTYLSFVDGGRWEARVLDLGNGEESSWAIADWQMPPGWTEGALAYARGGHIWLRPDRSSPPTSLGLPTLPVSAQASLSADGAYLAWSDERRLWVTATQDGVREAPRAVASRHQIFSFVWASDGRQLAYVAANEGPAPELWVARVDSATPPLLLVRGNTEIFSAPSWSPDGSVLAFSRTPTGAESEAASDIWLASSDGHHLRLLLESGLEESNPIWSPDGRHLAFDRAGDVWLLELPGSVTTATSPLYSGRVNVATQGSGGHTAIPSAPTAYQSASSAFQMTPPATIRVIHDAANPCRAVPVGQIDIIDFEEYVKRVVPQEMPPSWASAALKAQAVAARTYAWKHILLPANPNWDVTDWTRHQAMCDVTYSTTNEAVEATRGQYIAWHGNVIYAMYSAENGCPTKTYVTATFPDGVPYLMAVDDPVSFGEQVRGHGSGLSQWGAQRWADWHGWGYQQILMHYYSDVTVELPNTGGPTPLGSIVLPWPDHFVTSSRVYLAANASDEMSSVSGVGFYAALNTTTLLYTDTVGTDGWTTVWDAGSLSDTASTSVSLSALIVDGEGHTQWQSEVSNIGLDRRPPTGTMTTVADVYSDTITVTLSSLSATDPTPGSGEAGMAFANETWSWEGEELPHEQGSGQQIDDQDALNGIAWCGLVGSHSPGSWYGPYATGLQPGHAYRAYFRLRAGDSANPAVVATLDVVDDAGEHQLGLRHLRGTDFRATGVYQEFAVDFVYAAPGASGLEFRTAFRDTADLCLDRVLVVSYPVELAETFQWTLTAGDGPKTITAKFVDRAGNVSTDVTRAVTVLDTLPPGDWHGFQAQWQPGQAAPTCSVQVSDQMSGLDVDSARYRVSTDGGASWSDWAAAACTGTSGSTVPQTVTAEPLGAGWPSATDNLIEFQIADMRGHASSTAFPVRAYLNYIPLVLKT